MTDNTEIVRAMFASFNQVGVEPSMRFLHPDFELVIPPDNAIEPGTYRGHDGMRRYWGAFYEAMDEIRLVADQLTLVGNRVVVDLSLHARGKSTGLESKLEAFQVWSFEDGLARRCDVFADRDMALSAARMPE